MLTSLLFYCCIAIAFFTIFYSFSCSITCIQYW